MLKINHLTITTHKGRVLLKDFSFVLNQGDKIALIGEDGNGKSTILKAIAGIDLSAYATCMGEIFCDGRIAYLPQTIGNDALEQYVPYYINDEPDYNRLYSLCARVGIDTDLLSMRLMKTLSYRSLSESIAAFDILFKNLIHFIRSKSFINYFN